MTKKNAMAASVILSHVKKAGRSRGKNALRYQALERVHDPCVNLLNGNIES